MKIASIICCLMLSFWAQAQFTITGEIRPRSEFRNGFKSLSSADSDPAFFTEQRSRLYLNYRSEKVQWNITLQDVRLWGENSQIYKSDNSLFNVYEAWGSYALGDYSRIKVGRQALDYDNARFLGNLAWAQQARSHDLVKLEFDGTYQMHIGLAFNQEDVLSPSEPGRLESTFYSGVTNYKTMQYMWLNRSYDGNSTSLLILNNGVQSPVDSSMNYGQTFGLFSKNNFGAMQLTLEGYYQTGTDGQGRDISAYMGSVFSNFKFSSMSLGLGGDYLSGTNDASEKNRSFSPLYGTNHKFYGLMDYFFVGNSHQNVGLIDLYAKSQFKLGERSKLNLHVHEFFSQINLKDGQGEDVDDLLGTEIDLVYEFKFDDVVKLNLGYSQMLATESMELIKTGSRTEFNNWAWAMLTIKPQLFTSEE